MSSPLKSLGVEELSEAQRSLVSEYLGLAKMDGVVTGVLVGAEEWDLRPLVLENGRMEIVRIISASRSSDSYNAAVHALGKVTADYPIAFQPCRIAQSGNRTWLRRVFTSKTLIEAVDPFQAGGLEVGAGAVRQFLEALRALAQFGLSHGNLVMSNIGFENGALIPLDAGIHTLPGGNSEGATPERDLKNLGEIFKILKFTGCSPALVSDLTGIGSRDGAAIVILNELIDKFSSGTAERLATGSREVSAATPSSAPRGRLIEAKVAPRPTQGLTDSPVPNGPAKRSTASGIRIPTINLGTQVEIAKILRARIGDRRGTILLAGILLGFFGIAAVASGGFGLLTPKSRLIEYQKLWTSEQPEGQGIVIGEALEDPFSEALEVIRRDVLSGKKRPGVRSEMIRVAFDPLWFKELNSADRATVISLSMGDLVPENKRRVGSFNQLHPGVLLALAGMVNLEHPGDMFTGITLERFLKLPEPVAGAFKLFIDDKIGDLRDIAPRAFAHLYMGDGSTEVFREYLIGNTDIEFTRNQLRAIQPLLVKFPHYAKPLSDALTASGLGLAAQFGWFDADQTAQWANASPAIKLGLLSGVLPANSAELTLEQYIDLLQFPLPEVRTASQAHLLKKFISDHYRSVLLVLSSPENKLTRTQMIFLVSALQLPDEEAFSFFSRWFSGEPDPDTVFLILLSRSRTQKAAAFDIEAARYLIDRQWASSSEELGELVVHPEPLARALAYSRLNPKKPFDMKVLSGRLKTESNERMRTQIKEKLAAGR